MGSGPTLPNFTQLRGMMIRNEETAVAKQGVQSQEGRVCREARRIGSGSCTRIFL